MSNNPSLHENVSPAETGETDHQEGLPSPTQEAQLGLQNMGIGEREKHAKEIETCSTLLDQVRGVLRLDTDKVTRSKSKIPPTLKDLDDALLCSSVTAFKHAEAVGKVLQQLSNKVDLLEKELKLLKPRGEATQTSTKKNLEEEVNTQQNTEHQNLTPLPPRSAQTPGGSLQPQ